MNTPGPRRLVAAWWFVAAVASPGAAFAFKEPGHRAIEEAAYDELLSTPKGADVIATLIGTGVLNPPKRSMPGPTSNLYEDFEHHTAHGLVLESHLPDHLMDRQLDKELQCFHFNARGSHLTKISEERYGLPRGLVVDAYIECLGVTDAILRNVLFDPVGSNQKSVGMYTLMHMIEDSFADSHVARVRDPGRADDWKIIYLKPWNVRTWWSYFLATPWAPHGAPRHHFSDTHHQTMEPRDWGYLVGPMDDDDCAVDPSELERDHCPTDAGRDRTAYRERVKRCEEAASERVGKKVTLADLQSEMVVPPACLSDRAKRAKDAIVELLELVARHVRNVKPSRHTVDHGDAPLEIPCAKVGGQRTQDCFAEDWANYRGRHLAHVDDTLIAGPSDPSRADVRRDFVYPAPTLVPNDPFTGGLGLSTELSPGTPLWAVFDAFVAHTGAFHNSINPLDFMSYGLQLRLPIEDELGERPVGVAFEPGIVLPVPVSDLIGNDGTSFAMYAGLHARIAYIAKSVFERDSRHVIQYGFGGLSFDFVIGERAWFGVDFPRYMGEYDFWTKQDRATLTWSVSGGLATNAF
jgi:hypothetical protein